MNASRTPLFRRLAVAATVLVAAVAAQAQTKKNFQELEVEVVGNGKPVLMVPGLNSAGSVWRETCAALQPQVQCHIVQLPGFAGAKPAAVDAFLAPMRDRLLAYVDAEKLQAPVVVGHSLGGALALMMAAQQPAAVGRLVIVDSLPFIMGLRMPSATPEQLQGMAAQMKAGVLASPKEAYEQQTRQSAQGMSKDPARVATVIEWGLASDRATTAAAMSELWTADLRPLLPKVKAPTTVLGAWAAYAPMGSTEASTKAIFEQQYASLAGVQIRMSAAGYHFLMWDDNSLVVNAVREAVASK